MRVLLIEDDLKTASFISKGLTEAGFAVDHVTDGERGLQMASVESYDAAIVDIMLPKDGWLDPYRDFTTAENQHSP